MNRRSMRETAFQLIFEMAFHKDPVAVRIDEAVLCRELQSDDYIIAIVTSVQKNLAVIDAQISEYLTNWRIERIPRVTLALLRLAVCEFMLFPDIPVSVSINESIELAKKYATDEDGAFINGVLGTLARKNSYIKANVEGSEVTDASYVGN